MRSFYFSTRAAGESELFQPGHGLTYRQGLPQENMVESLGCLRSSKGHPRSCPDAVLTSGLRKVELSMRPRAIFDGSKLLAIMALAFCVVAARSANASAGASQNATATHHAFVVTGAMVIPRQAHTATRLANGMVLITGGINGAGRTIANAELFNPVTRRFIATGSMNVARVFHTATLLVSGQVLVAGGEGTTDAALTSAELYNPLNGKFSLTGSLTFKRLAHSATLLSNGTVLLAGGADGKFHSLPFAELFNPATGRFTSTSNLNAARLFHTATTLENGQVLLAGGNNSVAALASAERFTSLKKFVLTGSMTTPRTFHSASLLNSGGLAGQVLMAGGFRTGPLASAEIFSPLTNAFKATGSMNHARLVHTATRLNDGEVLIAGGEDNQNGHPLAPAELFNPETRKFTVVTNLHFPRLFHTATLLPSGMVLIAGGTNNATVIPEAELFVP